MSIVMRLWRDEAGAIHSAELLILGTILLIGIIPGVCCLRDAVLGELCDLSNCIASFDCNFWCDGKPGNGPPWCHPGNGNGNGNGWGWGKGHGNGHGNGNGNGNGNGHGNGNGNGHGNGNGNGLMAAVSGGDGGPLTAADVFGTN